MKPLILRVALAVLLLAAASHAFAVPPLINYQGRVAVGTPPVNFDGNGQFKFALVDGLGTLRWLNAPDVSPADAQPDSAVSLTVTKGLYSVLLGDTTIGNMAALPAAAFDHPAVYLRVWFNDGINGFQLLSPDSRIASVAYAVTAGTAASATTAETALSVPDGSITAAKIAPGVLPSSSGGPPSGAMQLFDIPPSRADLLAPEWSPVNPSTAATVLQAESWQALATQPPSPTFSLDFYNSKSHVAVWTGRELLTFGARLDTDQNADWYTAAARIPIAGTNDNFWSAITLANAPSGRWHAVGVWTGTAMLVWGGERQDYVDDMVFGDGASYSPTSFTWTPLPASGAPSPRTLAAAVWTGSEMIVWGGRSTVHYPFGGTGWLGDGKRYNPTSGTWSAMSATGAPSARGRHTAVWTGSEMIVFGGYGAAGESVGATAYNPASNTWRTLSASGAPSGRVFHTAVWSGSSMLVWGGQAPSLGGLIRNDGATYDPATDAWLPIPQIIPNSDYDAQHRERHTAVWAGREMIIWGGYGGTFQFPDATFGTGYAYRPDLGEWRSLPDTAADPGPRFGSDSVWTGGRVFVFGGKNTGSTYTNSISSFYLPQRLGYYYLKH